MRKVLIAMGTRPEAIKLAPVVQVLAGRPAHFRVRVLFTGQHRSLLDQVAHFFDIRPDIDLHVMTEAQTLPELTARLLRGIDEVLSSETPDVVLAQGDATTVFCTALACYYRRVVFGHVEAGLRTGNLYSPFPEEGNRRMTSLLAQYHFAPTASARESLLAEGVAPEAVHVTGNTVVDALLAIAARDLPLPLELGSKERVLLITLHRRESFGEPLRGMLRAVRQVLEARPDVIGVFPVHPNPNVRAPVLEVLGTMPNARLVAPLDYGSFVALMKRATLLLSDSGGVQEEAPSLKVPLLVLREDTERPEGIQAGAAKLVGTRPERIVPAALHLLDSPQARKAMQIADNPYGDGHAAERIADILQA